MKNKIKTLEALGGFVFSTNENFNFEENSFTEETPLPQKQTLEAHLDKKNRAGKIATIIKGFQGKDEDLKELGKMLKAKCGVGGSVKDKEIIIQGNFRDKIIEILQKEGYTTKRVGG